MQSVAVDLPWQRPWGLEHNVPLSKCLADRFAARGVPTHAADIAAALRRTMTGDAALAAEIRRFKE